MRVALGVEYNGARYSGWQRQSHVNSVQQEVETALSRICNHPVEIVCAGSHGRRRSWYRASRAL